MACFHYRTLLVIPDIDRSPFPIAGQTGEHAPKSLLFVPMMAQSEVIGVLELDQDDRVRDFTADEQALAQHLGNQIGVAIRLLDQRSRAGTALPHGEDGGRGAADFRRGQRAANAARLDHGPGAPRSGEGARRRRGAREFRPSPRKPPRPPAWSTRLVSYAAAEQVEARPVDINGLLRTPDRISAKAIGRPPASACAT